MAQNTYTIKKGDILGAIASKFGTKVSNIKGFRSGNPDLVFPGEKLTIGTSNVNEPKTRANEIRNTLAPDTTVNTPVDFNTFQTNLTDNKKKQEDAFKQLDGFRTKRYNELRKERGLSDFRSGIDTLDQQISQKKAERDSALAKVKKNPGASAATITGEVRGVTDQLNADINNLISQRNSKANSYNSTLGEIDRIVAQEEGDLQSKLGFFNSAVDNSSSALNTYNKSVVDELRRVQDRSLTESDSLLNFQRQLELARLRQGNSAGTNYTILTDFAGQPTVAINRKNPTDVINLQGATGAVTEPLPGGGNAPAGATNQAYLDQQQKQLDAQNQGGWWAQLLKKFTG